MRPKRVGMAAMLLAATLFVALAAPGTSQAQTPTAPAFTLTVHGFGSARIQPNEARVTLGVWTRGQDAQATLTENSTKMQAVIAALKQAGVAEADLRTTGLSVSPVYSPNPAAGDSPPRIEGFQASNTVQVTLRDLSRIGTIINAALTAGGNQVAGIQFTVQDPAAIRRQALQAAMSDAQASAQALASAAGVHLVGIRSVSESSCCAQPFAAMAGVAASVPPPVFGGEQTVEAQVEVVFDVSR